MLVKITASLGVDPARGIGRECFFLAGPCADPPYYVGGRGTRPTLVGLRRTRPTRAGLGGS